MSWNATQWNAAPCDLPQWSAESGLHWTAVVWRSATECNAMAFSAMECKAMECIAMGCTAMECRIMVCFNDLYCNVTD